MIKIEIPDKAQKKKDFFELLKPLIRERAELMLFSLKHLDGKTINVNDGGFGKYLYITRNIINFLAKGETIKVGNFNKKFYNNTVLDCLKKNKKGSDLEKVNFNNFYDFLKEILNPNENLLKEILICEASKINKTNHSILNKYNLNGESNNYILKLIFDYDNNNISGALKIFFRENNFVKFCPYCNLTEVIFTSTPKGTRASTTHQLDHFFDKSKHPLLACSFFNLIPSDVTCNGINKGSILFADEFHLNPYIRGFKRDLLFYPLLKGNIVREVNIRITSAKGTEIRKQMLGSSEEINQDIDGSNFYKEGNVNVFTIQSKYKDRITESQTVLDAIKARDNGFGAIKNYIKKMRGLNTRVVYLNWYKTKMKTSFEPKEFNDRAYSKFNRDMHDFYYHLDKKSRNKFIRKLIN